MPVPHRDLLTALPDHLRVAREADLDFVTERLAIGGDLDPFEPKARRQVREIVDLGITHVLDVRLEWTDHDVWETVPGVSYRWDGIDDAGQQVPAEWFDRIVTWALGALQDPDARVLAHCHMGINRGPSAAFAILLALGLDPVEALSRIRSVRSIAYVAYAEDALAWHHLCTNAPAEERFDDLRRVSAWRRRHRLDLAAVIRRKRRPRA